MPKLLSQAQVAAYHRDGYVFPLRAIAEPEMNATRARFDALCAQEGGSLSKRTNQKPHLLVTWLADMVRHPRIELATGKDIAGMIVEFLERSAAPNKTRTKGEG